MHPESRTRSRGRLIVGLIVATAALVAALVAAPAQAARDRNHDRIPDRWERQHKLSLKHNQAKRDQDRDGLQNLGEFTAGLNPRDADTDNDGTEDGDEGAGTIAAFDPTSGELTINLFAGGQLTGTVTADTEIKCDDEANDDQQGDDDQGDDAQGDDDQGDDEQGDDDSGQGGGDSGGEDRRSDGGDEGDETCGVADLVRDAVVSEADLEVNSQGAIFEEIELR